MITTPECLFENISQDNEVLQFFKDHSLRVMYLSSLLAKETGHYDEDLRIAALLHDIGKIGIAKEILMKPGRQNTIERAIVESHSHIGNVVVRKVLGKTRAAELIRNHHENWDGSGYPRGLMGEEVSIQGRIIRICDSFDAMTTNIKNDKDKKMCFTEAFDELIRCSWTQFDGNLVNTFISLIRDLNLSESWYEEYNVSQLWDIYNKKEVSK